MSELHTGRLGRAIKRLKLRGLFIMGAHLVSARLALRAANSVGRYVRVRGALYVDNRGGSLVVGDWVLLESTASRIALVVHEGARLVIGERSYLNFGVCIETRGEVVVGKGCHLGQHVQIMDNDQHDVSDHTARPRSAPVVLEDGVWLGARTIVLKGVTIGQGTTVGAGSVVTRSLPPRCLAAGVPARVIRSLDDGAQR